jgi:CRP-like cAMP-binding protein
MATAVTADGRTLALDVLGSGDAFGEPEGIASAVTVRALRPCRVRPAARAEAPKLLAARAGRVAALACDLAWLDVSGRVEGRLNDLAERFGRPVPGGTKIAIKLSQEDLAALTGTTRESVNRALRAMQREGRVRAEARGLYLVRG